MIILRQKEFGNKANRIAKKAFEQKIVDSYVDKFGALDELNKTYPGFNWKKIQDKGFKNIGRNTSLMNTVGGRVKRFESAEIPQAFQDRTPMSLDKKISLKGLMDKVGILGSGKERQAEVKEIAKGKRMLTLERSKLGGNKGAIWDNIR